MYTPSINKQIKNTCLKCTSDNFFLICCPIIIPKIAGIKAKADNILVSIVSKLLLCKATVSASVDKVKSIPIACISLSLGNSIACKNITPGTTKEPVSPVRIPLIDPANGLILRS